MTWSKLSDIALKTYKQDNTSGTSVADIKQINIKFAKSKETNDWNSGLFKISSQCTEVMQTGQHQWHKYWFADVND